MFDPYSATTPSKNPQPARPPVFSPITAAPEPAEAPTAVEASRDDEDGLDFVSYSIPAASVVAAERDRRRREREQAESTGKRSHRDWAAIMGPRPEEDSKDADSRWQEGMNLPPQMAWMPLGRKILGAVDSGVRNLSSANPDYGLIDPTSQGTDSITSMRPFGVRPPLRAAGVADSGGESEYQRSLRFMEQDFQDVKAGLKPFETLVRKFMEECFVPCRRGDARAPFLHWTVDPDVEDFETQFRPQEFLPEEQPGPCTRCEGCMSVALLAGNDQMYVAFSVWAMLSSPRLVKEYIKPGDTAPNLETRLGPKCHVVLSPKFQDGGKPKYRDEFIRLLSNALMEFITNPPAPASNNTRKPRSRK